MLPGLIGTVDAMQEIARSTVINPAKVCAADPRQLQGHCDHLCLLGVLSVSDAVHLACSECCEGSSAQISV